MFFVLRGDRCIRPGVSKASPRHAGQVADAEPAFESNEQSTQVGASMSIVNDDDQLVAAFKLAQTGRLKRQPFRHEEPATVSALAIEVSRLSAKD